jgi:hypothetical protein
VSALLWTGALLAFAIGLAHSYLGERYLLIRLFRRGNLPKLLGSEEYTRRTIRFAWHITTLAWWGFAAQMAWAAGAGAEGATAGTPYLRILAATFALSGLVSLVAARGRHYSWIVFLAIAACAWWGG